jgi:hypothetical protein
MHGTKVYFVWRRNDGHIGASANGMPQNYVTGGADPEKGSTVRASQGIPVTFEKLGEFTEWFGENGAHDFILAEMQKAGAE